jgi:aerobic-type carbon monoxide dehydrogenase small subunit (CoxS/CutS family)
MTRLNVNGNPVEIAIDPETRRARSAWMELDVPQCGYFQSGQIISYQRIRAAENKAQA